MTLTVGSLFSGIGGLELGLELVGMQVKWQVEFDEYCQKVLEKRWPNVKRFGDINEVRGKDLEYVDIICGGFPCQPVSLAGRRKGKEDKRWLWPEFYRIVCEVRPEWVLVENVPGLLSADSGQLFAGILRDLAEAGYDAEWSSVRAEDVGARHRRERIFIVAHTESKGSGELRKSCDEKGARCGDVLSGISSGLQGNVADTTDLRINSRGFGSERERQTHSEEWWRGQVFGSCGYCKNVADTICNSKRTAQRNESRFGCRRWDDKNILKWNRMGCNSGNSSGSGDLADSEKWRFEAGRQTHRTGIGGENKGHNAIGRGEVPDTKGKRFKGLRKEGMQIFGTEFAKTTLGRIYKRNAEGRGIWSTDPADIPDTDERGLQEARTEQSTAVATRDDRTGDISNTAMLRCNSNTPSGKGLQRRELPLGEVGAEDRTSSRREGATQSRLGRMANGFSAWVDFIPRTTLEKKHRVARIKCLGNAVVPQVSEYVGLLILHAAGELDDETIY